MWLRLGVLLVLLAVPAVASAQAAQAAADDAEARALFDLGTAAFDDARYEDALGHFQHSYQRSHRPALLYNIGICADRLRRDVEALDAFERFLAAVPDHPRRHDVEARVEILRGAVTANSTPVTAPIAEPEETPVDGGSSALSVVGPVALGAVGLAGVVAGLVGVVGSGGCVDYAVPGDATTPCIEETRTSWAPVALYGGLGLAVLVGAVVWLVVGLSGGDDDAPVSLSARGTELVWRF